MVNMFKLPTFARWILLISGVALILCGVFEDYVEKYTPLLAFLAFPYSWAVGMALFFIGLGEVKYKEEGKLETIHDQTPGFRSRKDGFFSGTDGGGNDAGGGGGGGDG